MYLLASCTAFLCVLLVIIHTYASKHGNRFGKIQSQDPAEEHKCDEKYLVYNVRLPTANNSQFNSVDTILYENIDSVKTAVNEYSVITKL